MQHNNDERIPFILTNEGITIMLDKKPKVVRKDHASFSDIVEALNNNDSNALENLVDLGSAIVNKGHGRITVKDGQVLFNNNGSTEVIDNSITKRIIQAVEMGLEVDNMIKFLDRLQDNPSYRSRQQLFGFLEACDLPILSDGRFLAYKAVKHDLWDTHTGKTFKNDIGAVIKMDRSKVDDDPNNTCSAGLHVCSQGYTKYGDVWLHVAVAPEDVVSVPTDYKQSKMRVCEYQVLEFAPDDEMKSWESPSYNPPSYDDNEDDFWEDDEDIFDWEL